MSERDLLPACRVGATPEQLAREADRAVLYAAILLVRNPKTRIKPELVQAANALEPSVRAFLAHSDDALAGHALAYARACGGDAFLLSKRGEKPAS